MPKTRKTLQPINLEKYDVYIEDKIPTSEYFNINGLPQTFTGGRNSFLITGSPYLKDLFNVLVEIVDAKGNTIYQKTVANYTDENSRLVSVEIYDNTATGYAKVTVIGILVKTADNKPIPPQWQNKYNVRWTGKVLVNPKLNNVSPIRFSSTPTVFTEEKRFYSVDTSSFTKVETDFTASIFPILTSTSNRGYSIKAISPATFSSEHNNAILTGSISINGSSLVVNLPITKILNSTTGFSKGYDLVYNDGTIIDKLYIQSGSYTTTIAGNTAIITSSVKLQYYKLTVVGTKIPISYAKVRAVNLNTATGEIYKTKVYSKVSTNPFNTYKLIANSLMTTDELLVSSSIRGDIPIGDFYELPSASASWYADTLGLTTNPIYKISGSAAYYDSSLTVNPIELQVSDDVLLRSIKAEVPTINNNSFSGIVSESGYFVGTKQPTDLFQSTEYTLKFQAYYKKSSGSINLVGQQPQVDIYILGVNGTTIVSKDPLGQNIGQLTVNATAETAWFENVELNFKPALSTLSAGKIGVRFIIKNGFWNFSNISLKPASDELFSPDEIQILIPNTEYHNEYLEHKLEFFDINTNSTNTTALSLPTFFTGSNIDFGILQ